MQYNMKVDRKNCAVLRTVSLCHGTINLIGTGSCKKLFGPRKMAAQPRRTPHVLRPFGHFNWSGTLLNPCKFPRLAHAHGAFIRCAVKILMPWNMLRRFLFSRLKAQVQALIIDCFHGAVRYLEADESRREDRSSACKQ